MKVCVSASIKFKDQILEVSQCLSEQNIACVVPEMDISKDMELDEMVPDLVYRHFKKIRESDAVLVVNPDGYIGNSVKVEIGYAKGLGKKVYFLEKTNAPELDCLADEILEANKFDVFR